MSGQSPGMLRVELVDAGIRIIAVLIAEELGEGIIRLVREFERVQSAKIGWDVT